MNHRLHQAIVLLILSSPLSAGIAQTTWDGGAGTTLWSDANNWNPNGVPATTSDLLFTGSSSLAISLNGNRTAKALYFSGTSGYTLANSILTLTSGTISVSAPASGTVTDTIASAVSFAAEANLSIGSNATLNLSGGTSGAVSLNKTGSGMLILSGGNAYTGGTTITAGTLQLGNGGSAGTVSGNIANNANLAFNFSSLTDVSSVISGTGTVTQNGTATVRLTGANTFAGDLTINSAAVTIGNGGSTGSITANVVDNATLIFNRTADYSYGGMISGSGSIYKVNSNTLTLTGTNTYAGTTHLEGGTINFAQDSNLGTGIIQFNGGALQWATGNTADISTHTVQIDSGGATLDTNGNNVTLANAIGNSGTGALTKTGSGTLTLTGANTYSGGTTVSAGTLQIGNGGTTGSITGNIVNNANVTFNRSDAITYSGVISGLGTLTSKGNYSVTLTGNNAFTGKTTVNNGSLYLGNGGTTGSLTGDLQSDGFTAFNRSDNVTYSGTISGSGYVAQVGSGTVTLSGAIPTFTGRINAGGTGAMIINGGTAISAYTLSAGVYYYGGDGTLTIDGPGTAVTTIGGVQLGTSKNGVLNLTNGATVIIPQSGDLNLGHGPGGTATINLSGGSKLTTYSMSDSGTFTFNNGTFSLTGTNSIDNPMVLNSGGGTLEIASGKTLTNSAVISGTGALTKTGSGTLTLTGTNTYTGGTTVSAGTLQIGSGGTMGSITGNIVNNANVTFNRSDAITYSGVISGSGTLTSQGNYSVTLTGNNTFTGKTTATSSLYIGNGGTSGSIAGDLQADGFTVFNRSDNVTYAGTINGSGYVAQWGSGTLTLSGAIPAFTGRINAGGTGELIINSGVPLSVYTLSAGVYYYGNAGTLTIDGAGTAVTTTGGVQIGTSKSGVFNLTNGATVTIPQGGDLDLAHGPNSSAAVNISGGSKLTTYSMSDSGTFTFNNGTFSLTGTNSIDNPMVLNSGGGTLQIASGKTLTNRAVISGAGALTKTGAGTLTLTGANTYTGTTTVSAGTLKLSSSTSNNPIGQSSRIIVGDISDSTGALDVTGITTAGGFQVQSGQMLAGHGEVVGNTTFLGGSSLSPGNSAGTTTFAGNLALQSGASLVFDLASEYLSDTVVVTGTLTLDSLQFSDFAFSTQAGFEAGTYVLMEADGGILGALGTNVSGTLTEGGTSYHALLSLNGDELQLQVAVVPEPGTWALLLGGFAVLVYYQRVRHRNR